MSSRVQSDLNTQKSGGDGPGSFACDVLLRAQWKADPGLVRGQYPQLARESGMEQRSGSRRGEESEAERPDPPAEHVK
jgi:hypothetical protein